MNHLFIGLPVEIKAQSFFKFSLNRELYGPYAQTVRPSLKFTPDLSGIKSGDEWTKSGEEWTFCPYCFPKVCSKC